MPQRTLRFRIRQDGLVEESVEGLVGAWFGAVIIDPNHDRRIGSLTFGAFSHHACPSVPARRDQRGAPRRHGHRRHV